MNLATMVKLYEGEYFELTRAQVEGIRVALDEVREGNLTGDRKTMLGQVWELEDGRTVFTAHAVPDARAVIIRDVLHADTIEAVKLDMKHAGRKPKLGRDPGAVR